MEGGVSDASPVDIVQVPDRSNPTVEL